MDRGPFRQCWSANMARENEFIQDIADNLAKDGYVACAPELYHRVTV